MKRSIATCKRCGTQFPMVGEISGCVNCGHSELAVQPEPGDWKELEKMAQDMSNEDIDAFMAQLSKEYSQTQKFIAELEAEFDMDQAVRELMEDFDPTPAERTQMAKGQTPYEKGKELESEGIVEMAMKDWPNEPHHSHCCCDKCAPTKEDAYRRAAEFEMDKAIDDAISTVPKEPPAPSPRKKDPKLRGNCRTCGIWNQLAPQAGSCILRKEEDRPITSDGVRVTMWFETCQNYRINTHYRTKQIEIREKRKAHHSIIRAMERNKS